MPSFGIAMQVVPATSEILQRLHAHFFSTSTRFGLPFVPPINEGTGPLGLILFIVGFGLSDPSREGLEDVIKFAQYFLELIRGSLRSLFS